MQCGVVLSPETLERLGTSKHVQVMTHLVHPHGWSILPSTVLHALTCVFAAHVQFVAHA